MLSGERSVSARSDVILVCGDFTVREMTLTWPKALMLWNIISKYRTLFSDLTRGDFDNFFRFITAKRSIWLEIVRNRVVIGIICLVNLDKVVDIDAHVIFFDRDLSEKIPVSKAVVYWAFMNLPIQRITVDVPTIYYATIRLVKKIGFQEEGCKRNAVLIGGNWVDSYVFGITRREALERCHS